METEKIQLKLVLNPELYQQLKMLAEQKGMPLKEYIEQALEQAMEEKERQDELHSKRWKAFERLRQLRESIARNHPGVDFGDSTEIIRQMREERSQYLADL